MFTPWSFHKREKNASALKVAILNTDLSIKKFNFTLQKDCRLILALDYLKPKMDCLKEMLHNVHFEHNTSTNSNWLFCS